MPLTPIGTIYSKDFFTSLNDIYNNGNGSIVYGAIRNNDSSIFGLALGTPIAPIHTVLDELTIEWRMTVVTPPNNNSGNSISIGINSSNLIPNLKSSFQALFLPQSSSTRSGFYDDSTATSEFGNEISISSNDKLIFTLKRTINSISSILKNVTTNETSALFRPSTHRGYNRYNSNTANICF